MQPIDRIQEIIDIYDGNFDGVSLEFLMDLKSELVILLFRYSQEVGNAKGDSVISTVVRKYHHHKSKATLIDNGYTVGYAESKSLANTRDMMMEEAEKEKLEFTSKLLLDAGYQIAMDMTQRISVLKKEKEQSNAETN